MIHSGSIHAVHPEGRLMIQYGNAHPVGECLDWSVSNLFFVAGFFANKGESRYNDIGIQQSQSQSCRPFCPERSAVNMKKGIFLSHVTRRWLLLFVVVWVVSCAIMWMAAPVYLILLFAAFQFAVFPVLMFGGCASAGWKADLGFLRWLLPAVLGLGYSVWPLNMLVASKPSLPGLSFVLFGMAVSYLGLIAGTIARRIRSPKTPPL